MIISHSLVTEPANLPVSLADTKNWLRVSGSTDDALITQLIKTSAARLSNYCKTSFQTASYSLVMDDFYSDRIPLPMPPAVAVSAIYYYDADNTENTLSSSYYRVDTVAHAVVLNDGYDWPTVYRDYAGVKILYTAGYGTAEGSVPDAIKTAIMTDVSRLYESRGQGCEISADVKATLAPYTRLDYLGVAAAHYGDGYGFYGV